MAHIKCILLLAVGLLIFAQGSWSLKCYICESSGNDTTCNDPFPGPFNESLLFECSDWCDKHNGYIPGYSDPKDKNDPTRVSCPTAFNSCRKIKQSSTAKARNNGNPEERLFRTCGFADNGTVKDYMYRSAEDYKSEVFSCITDRCNSANFGSVSSVLTGIALLTSILAFWFLLPVSGLIFWRSQQILTNFTCFSLIISDPEDNYCMWLDFGFIFVEWPFFVFVTVCVFRNWCAAQYGVFFFEIVSWYSVNLYLSNVVPVLVLVTFYV